MARHDAGSAEDRLIARYFKPLAKHPGAFGFIDDAAALTPPPGHDLVLKTDGLIVGGVHFFPDDPADGVARKALRVNLSDLAAKGAKPLGFLLALALPKGFDEDWLAAFRARARRGCGRLRMPAARRRHGLARRVRSASRSRRSARCRAARWSGAAARKAGDRVFVTGTIGDAALGLRLRKGEREAWKLDAADAASISCRAIACRSRAMRSPKRCARMRPPRWMCRTASRAISPSSAAPRASRPTSRSRACRCRTPRAQALAADCDADRADPDRRRGLRDPLHGRARAGVAAFRGGRATAGVPVTDIGRIVAGDAPPRFLDPEGRPLRLLAPRLQPFLSISRSRPAACAVASSCPAARTTRLFCANPLPEKN